MAALQRAFYHTRPDNPHSTTRARVSVSPHSCEVFQVIPDRQAWAVRLPPVNCRALCCAEAAVPAATYRALRALRLLPATLGGEGRQAGGHKLAWTSQLSGLSTASSSPPACAGLPGLCPASLAEDALCLGVGPSTERPDPHHRVPWPSLSSPSSPGPSALSKLWLHAWLDSTEQPDTAAPAPQSVRSAQVRCEEAPAHAERIALGWGLVAHGHLPLPWAWATLHCVQSRAPSPPRHGQPSGCKARVQGRLPRGLRAAVSPSTVSPPWRHCHPAPPCLAHSEIPRLPPHTLLPWLFGHEGRARACLASPPCPADPSVSIPEPTMKPTLLPSCPALLHPVSSTAPKPLFSLKHAWSSRTVGPSQGDGPEAHVSKGLPAHPASGAAGRMPGTVTATLQWCHNVAPCGHADRGACDITHVVISGTFYEVPHCRKWDETAGQGHCYPDPVRAAPEDLRAWVSPRQNSLHNSKFPSCVSVIGFDSPSATNCLEVVTMATASSYCTSVFITKMHTPNPSTHCTRPPGHTKAESQGGHRI